MERSSTSCSDFVVMVSLAPGCGLPSRKPGEDQERCRVCGNGEIDDIVTTVLTAGGIR
jgi:hypothetical protein